MHNKYIAQNNLIMGIDSGATNTDVLVTTVDGTKKYIKKFEPINYNLLGSNKTAATLCNIIKLSSDKIPIKNFSYIVAGISGARYKQERRNLQQRISHQLRFNRIKILPDTEIALASVFDSEDENCGVLIAGTGSILYVKKNGKRTRIGGWGRILGDEGGSYWIGREALNRITKYYDGISKETILATEINKVYRINKNNILKKIYHENFEIPKIASLVFRCANMGDILSKSIIKDATLNLLNLFAPLKKIKYLRIALCGALFNKETLLEKYFLKFAKSNLPRIQFIKPKLIPVWGAIEIARHLISYEHR